ncbi:MAG TPA: nitrite reductase (NAD(P)H) small subunit [Flavisolibacter sp.]|nr:nitrite reductase (NAD(P)H) small subunit [Flavisolibacter sp.]
MTSWIKIAESIAEINFQENHIAEISADGKTICLAKFNDQYFACAQKCPHASGLFVEGYIDAVGNVVCPIHRYKFSLKNGRNITGEGYFLKVYPVELRENGVYVGIDKPWWS